MGPERTLGRGVVSDTVEIAAVWRRLPRLYEAVRGILSDHARSVGCVVGHTHRSGASLLFPFLIRAKDDRAAEEAYVAAWTRALRATREAGGTVSYHHGVGLLKREALGEELGEVGVWALSRLFGALDPEGRLNPGKVLPPGPNVSPEPRSEG
jgi:alkyldihydroxyacetonephosphate synthase